MKKPARTMASLAAIVFAAATVSAGGAAAAELTKDFTFTVRSFIDRPIVPGTFGAGRVQQLMLKLLAKFTQIATGDHGNNDRRDKKYRLYSRRTITIKCQGEKISWSAKAAETDTGKEGPLQAPAALATIKDTPAVINDGRTFTLAWGYKAMPHAWTLPGFNAIQQRTCHYIRHTVSVNCSCRAGQPACAAKLGGSRFPSHSLLVNNKKVKSIAQGPFTNLWACKGTNVR